MRRKKLRSQLDTIDQINITPLLDLTFLLLIVFMITTPLMENGLDLTPPTLSANALPAPEANAKTVNFDRYGQIKFGGEILTREALIARLQAMYMANPNTKLLLRADGERAYKEVIEIMGDIRASGFKSIELVTLAGEK